MLDGDGSLRLLAIVQRAELKYLEAADDSGREELREVSMHLDVEEDARDSGLATRKLQWGQQRGPCHCANHTAFRAGESRILDAIMKYTSHQKKASSANYKPTMNWLCWK